MTDFTDRTIYEQQDHALHAPAAIACYRCGRRSYVAEREWVLFTSMVISSLENRCAGCGYAVSGCPCADARQAA